MTIPTTIKRSEVMDKIKELVAQIEDEQKNGIPITLDKDTKRYYCICECGWLDSDRTLDGIYEKDEMHFYAYHDGSLSNISSKPITMTEFLGLVRKYNLGPKLKMKEDK